LNRQCHLFTAKALEDVVCLEISNKNIIKSYVKSPRSVQVLLRNAVNTVIAMKGNDHFITPADIKKILIEYDLEACKPPSSKDDMTFEG